MANRILIGNRTTGGYGMYVSRPGDDVLTTTEPLAFDSRAGGGWAVKKIQESSIAPNSSPNYHTVGHGLGYNPLVALRWTTSVTSGVATAVYDPGWGEAFREDAAQEPDEFIDSTWRDGCIFTYHDTNNIRVHNMCNEAFFDADPPNSYSSFLSNSTVYYAIIIFHNEDYTGGKGL